MHFEMQVEVPDDESGYEMLRSMLGDVSVDLGRAHTHPRGRPDAGTLPNPGGEPGWWRITR